MAKFASVAVNAFEEFPIEFQSEYHPHGAEHHALDTSSGAVAPFSEGACVGVMQERRWDAEAFAKIGRDQESIPFK